MHPTFSGFEPAHGAPSAIATNSYVFLYQGQQVAVVSATEAELPVAAQVPQGVLSRVHYFGEWHQRACYAGVLPQAEALPGLDWVRLRGLYTRDALFWVAGRGHHMAHWHHTHRHCGVCGAATEVGQQEALRSCTACGHTVYPRISPAVIMAVIRDGHILLGKINRPGVSLYSVLAGFVEPGESLEGCVAREVKEEAGIEVKNIRYFGSQPWAFPDQLMVGFTAEYAGGEIVLEDELEEAGWFSVADLPNIPPKPSIARALIDWFCENH